MKKCGKCLKIKTFSEYTFSKAKNSYHYACKVCVKIINSEYYKVNREKVIEQVKQCGENLSDFLCIDHVNNDGKEHRKTFCNMGFGIYLWLEKNDYPKGSYQLLCHNCNFSKHKNKGICAHQFLEGSTTRTKVRIPKREEVRSFSMREDDIV